MADPIYRLEDHHGRVYIAQGKWIQSTILDNNVMYGDFIDHIRKDRITNGTFYKLEYCIEVLSDKYKLKDYIR